MRDHAKAMQEFLLTLFWGFLPILGSTLLFLLFPLEYTGVERVFHYIDNGTILIYTAAFVAPISYLTHHVFNESSINGRPFPHRFAFSLSFYTIIVCALIVHIGSEALLPSSAIDNLNSSIRWLTVLILATALFISYLGFVYRNALSGPFSEDTREEEKSFADAWKDQKNG